VITAVRGTTLVVRPAGAVGTAVRPGGGASPL